MSSTPISPAPPLDVRGLLWRFVLGIVLLVGALALVAYTFRDELLLTSHWFVEHLGGAGVGLGFLLPDALTLPIPQDAFLAFGLMGGLDFWSIAAWGTVGSVVGGSLGFFLGRYLGSTRWYRHRTRGLQSEALVQRYGVGAVAIGALTPLPYSLTCWAAGALGMPFLPFLAASSLRVIRVLGYLWLLQLGVVKMLG